METRLGVSCGTRIRARPEGVSLYGKGDAWILTVLPPEGLVGKYGMSQRKSVKSIYILGDACCSISRSKVLRVASAGAVDG